MGEKTSIEKHWDATIIDSKVFVDLLKFDFGYDMNGNNYIVLNDNNEMGRFYAESDDEAKSIFRRDYLKEDKLQEDDEVNEDEVDVENTDDLQSKLDEFKDISGFYKFVVEDVLEDCDYYDGETLNERLKKRLDDIIEHGCVSGTVGSLVYYSDTVKAFDEYADDIYDLIDSSGPDEFLESLKNHVDTTEIILNCDSAKNWIVWMAYEDVAYQLYNTIE